MNDPQTEIKRLQLEIANLRDERQGMIERFIEIKTNAILLADDHNPTFIQRIQVLAGTGDLPRWKQS